MTTITATPDLTAGTITVSITKTETIDELLRVDVNGTRPVRVPASIFPSSPSGTIKIVDHEAALGGAVTYRAGTAEPAWTAFPAGSRPRFTLPMFPTVSVPVRTVTGYDHARESASTVHEILGRSGDPIISRAPLKPRTGRLSVRCDTWQEVSDLSAVMEMGHDVLYRQAEHLGADMYFSVRQLAVEETEEWWTLNIEFLEVKAPIGDRAFTGAWDFQDLADRPGASFNTIAQDYPSFVTLTLDQPR